MIEFIIRRVERTIRVPMDYLRAIARSSPLAFWKFALMAPAMKHRRSSPLPVWHAARIVATQREDCGTCVQAAVNQAIDDGVDLNLLKAIVHRESHLPEQYQTLIQFVEASLDGAEDIATPLREQLRNNYGEATLVEIALGIATTRVFPTIKKVLGYAKTCSLVPVDFATPANR